MIGKKTERLKDLDTLYPEWEAHTIWSRFEKNAGYFPENDFLISESGTSTYQQTKENSRKIAKALLYAGVSAGSHVGLFLRNCREFVFLTLALSMIGAVKVPMNANVKKEELDFLLDQADISFLVCREMPEINLTECPAFSRLKHMVFFEQKDKDTVYEKAESWNTFLKGADRISDAELERKICHDSQGLSDIIFTSGSTSRPKGVMLTNDMLLRSSYATCRTRGMEMGRRIYVPVPLFHAMGYVEGLLAVIYVGGAVILSEEKFSAEHALAMMKRHCANDIICVSLIMMKLLTEGRPQAEDYPCMHAAYWTMACPDWAWEAGKRCFGITDVSTGYGMTECGSTSTMTAPEDASDCVLWCHGKLKDAGGAGEGGLHEHLLELKICDVETGQALPFGEQGELWCRGTAVTKGYYKNKEATTRVLDQEGWFHTGDLGRLTAKGYFTFCGRKDDTYKINGENVSPQFLDTVLGNCPLIKAVETVGVCHPRCGAVGVAFIELKEPSAHAEQEIRQYCKKHLAKYQIPKYMIFSASDSWPKTDSGKVQKRKLRIQAETILQKDMRKWNDV